MSIRHEPLELAGLSHDLSGIRNVRQKPAAATPGHIGSAAGWAVSNASRGIPLGMTLIFSATAGHHRISSSAVASLMQAMWL